MSAKTPKRKKLDQTSVSVHFDWDEFDRMIQQHGGINHVAQSAGTSRQAYYYVRGNKQIPLIKPIFDIANFMGVSANQMRRLFRTRRGDEKE